ncbi:hypothetical protein HIM_10423 [Hirsutella minnesotensis 3608]|uniref:Uncharacterized protein n=1 Tax=Hirsutella minnesotensis 3608 TaxID=1043627 RepID=A0A0F7ZK48_9HYPO|nr:hypothetical protein HIM_10423 [Hirsutella minnesotensis 3608]
MAVADCISADVFSELTIPKMGDRVSGLLCEVGDFLQGRCSSFIWLGPLSDFERRDDAPLPISEAIVRERKMLDRCYVALALPTADKHPQGRRLLVYELAEQFPSCFGDEEYPDDDWAAFDISLFSRSQKESLALWFSLQTLQMVARVVGNPDCAKWTGDVLRNIDGRVKEGVLGGKL